MCEPREPRCLALVRVGLMAMDLLVLPHATQKHPKCHEAPVQDMPLSVLSIR